MSKNIVLLSLRKVIILSASFLFILSSCKKEGELNPDFVENTSFTSFTDQLSISTNTVISDSIFADRVSTGLVGAYRDSVFGLSKAAVHFQPLLSSNFLVFGESNETLITDSVVLSMEYDGIYGDTLPQTFEVYRIDETLDIDESYSTNTEIQIQPSPIATQTFTPSLNKPVKIYSPNQGGGIDTLTLNPQLRIQLDKSIGDEILDQSGQATVANNSNFTSFFKGLKVQAVDPGNLNNNQNAILYFALTASATKMTIYYSAVDAQNDTTKKSVDFPINSSSVRFNTFEHDFSNSAVSMVIQDQKNDSLYSYTQAMAGIQTTITFPGIESLKDKDIVVNKAELEIPVSSGSYSSFGFADALIVAAKDESGALQFIPDFFEGESYFGGSFSPSSQSYKFNISRYIQALINGTETKKELTLLVTGSAVKAERVVVFAPQNPNRKIKLNLYYSNTN